LGRKNKVSQGVEKKPSEKTTIFLQGGVCLLLTYTLMDDHTGFVVFDEPRQHETSKISFTSLIQKASESEKDNSELPSSAP